VSVDDLAVALLEGLREGRDPADLYLEPLFDLARRLNERAEMMTTSTPGELDVVARTARACVALINAQLGCCNNSREVEASARRAKIGLDAVAQDIAAAYDLGADPKRLRQLAQFFDRARVIASSRRRTLRTGRDEFVTFSDRRPRRDILPALNVRVQQRGPSRQTRPRRRTRPPARAPARLGDEPPPDHDHDRDLLGRASERRAA
jgi:hypothetical protein